MSNVSKRKKDSSRTKLKTMGDHKEFLKRISKTLYYGQLPALPCLSLPVTEISCSLWSVAQRGRSLRRLHADAAAGIARSACVSPCALVLAILYLERLKRCNPDYLAAATPADLFLVSLMVSNKFLQDDGEDDEVICSEWAASGGLEVDQLKKLEIEFLSAIEWNVFVSEKSFETGLEWLEREVALKQAQLHGFFTYSDLAAACPSPPIALLPDLARACIAAALAYLTGFAAILASTLVFSHVCLPSLQHLVTTSADLTVLSLISSAETNIISHDYRPAIHHQSFNHTEDDIVDLLAEGVAVNLECCEKWARYRDSSETKRNWYDGIVVYDWKSFEPWWSRTSVLNWLYQTSLISPVQRWLEKMNEYADWMKRELEPEQPERQDRCDGHAHMQFGQRQRCIRQWLHLGKLSVLVASVSDR